MLIALPMMPLLSFATASPPPRPTRDETKQRLRRLWCEDSILAKFEIESEFAADPSLRRELFAPDWEPQWTREQRDFADSFANPLKPVSTMDRLSPSILGGLLANQRPLAQELQLRRIDSELSRLLKSNREIAASA